MPIYSHNISYPNPGRITTYKAHKYTSTYPPLANVRDKTEDVQVSCCSCFGKHKKKKKVKILKNK